MARETWRDKIIKLWKADEIRGIELIFDSCVLALRYLSLSYWSKDIWLVAFLDSHAVDDTRRRRRWRDSLIDAYCIAQLLVLTGLLFLTRHPVLAALLSVYILFEIYLNLFSIFFLPRTRKLGPPQASDSPSAVNEPSTRVERSILLLFVNVLQVILAFAIIYKASAPVFTPSTAFFGAVFVFGTLGAPPGISSPLVAAQVVLDFILVAAILANFVGQAGPFGKN
jgi:hypothetical protein